jgi:hypothetical protein
MIITNFDDISSLNEYYINSFNNTHLYSLNNVLYALIKNGGHSYISSDGSYDDDQVQDWLSTNNIDLNNYVPFPDSYFFLGSKTSYRKTVHPFVVDSTYKRLYNSLKSNSYILEANASHVILRKDRLTDNVFNDVFLPSSNIDSLEQILNEFKELRSDVKYYNAIITSLVTTIEEQLALIDSLNSRINDTQLSTWA